MGSSTSIESQALPSSLDAERSTLGAIMLDEKAFSEARSVLTPDDFSLDSHRRIFARMAKLDEQGKPIDIVMLVEELRHGRELEAIGGPEYIAGMLDGVPDRPAIAHYVRIVKEKSKLRQIIRAADSITARAMEGDSASDISAGMIETALQVEEHSQGKNLLTFRQIMPEVLRELEREAKSGALVGLPTGLACLDRVLGGIRPGELIVIGALPGKGKTAFACQILGANAELQNPTAVFSAEMSRSDIGKRVLSARGPLTAQQIRHPHSISKEEWSSLAKSAAEVCEWLVWLDDTGGIGIAELVARARLLISRNAVKLVIVDHLQLIQADARDVRERVSKVAEAMRQLAKSAQVAVILLSQLRRPRDAQDVPTMLDLKESGDIEAAAHVVLLLHTPENDSGQPTGEDLIIVGKNRNGPKGPLPVRFRRNDLTFHSRETRQ